MSVTMTPSNPIAPLSFTIRPARFRDTPAVARAHTLGFWNDVLFGRLIHPHRQQHPHDVDIYWLKRIQYYFWDWSHMIIVATTTSAAPRPDLAILELQDSPSEESRLLSPKLQETIVGAAHWSRASPFSASHPLSNYTAGYALPWYSPLRILQPLFGLCWSILTHLNLRPNRAADLTKEPIIEQSYDYLNHIWTLENHRSPTWHLDSLAVRPDYQNAGVGRALVQWGLKQAEQEGVCCSVISASGKERFYQRCGFDVGPVGWSGEGEGNPLVEVPGGLAFVREAREVREGRVQRPETRRKGVCYDGEIEFV